MKLHSARQRSLRLLQMMAVVAVAAGAVACGGEPESASSDSGGGSVSAFCQAEKKLEDQAAKLDPSSDAQKVATLIDSVAEKAPKSLKADLQVIADSYRDRSPSGPVGNQDKLQAAGQRVSDYLTKNCSVLQAPQAGKTLTGDTPCPKADGSSERVTTFAKAPPRCIDPAKTYTATFDTSKGKFTATLDAKAAPVGVNNFVVLARYHFYDGVPFHRIVPDFVIQGGDATGEPWGTHGPGYTIAEEPPKGSYAKYDLAMAKSSEAKSTGSQFFVVTGDPAALNQTHTYTLFGKVTGGKDVVDAIAKTPVGGDQGDTPTEAVVMRKVTITES